jgi:hypothetical protein
MRRSIPRAAAGTYGADCASRNGMDALRSRDASWSTLGSCFTPEERHARYQDWPRCSKERFPGSRCRPRRKSCPTQAIAPAGIADVLRIAAALFNRCRGLFGLTSLGRELTALGHQVRMMPDRYVKPYVQRGKSDALDADAICEAVSRPAMRFAAIKTAQQQAVLTLHRTRESLSSR